MPIRGRAPARPRTSSTPPAPEPTYRGGVDEDGERWLDVDRRQALAFRMVAQGLDRATTDPTALAVLDLGVQETNVGSARVALAARLPEDWGGARGGDVLADAALSTAWTFRGAPHVHRSTDLAGLAGQLWPVGDGDARARLAAERKPLAKAGIGALMAFNTTAEALRDVVTGPTPKGDASAAVSARLPSPYSYACRSCAATHVYGGLFQLAGIGAGIGLVTDASPATLVPLPHRGPAPPESSGPGGLLRAYLRLHGPATLAEAAAYLGSTQTALRAAWPEDLAEVRLDGRRTWIPPELLDALRTAPPAADLVRLLPPSDPWLQGRDRDFVVPERARQKAVWRILGNPGAVLVDAEVVGVWRARTAGRGRLDVTVQAFEPLAPAVRTRVEAEAGRLAATRGAADVRVRYDEG